MVSIKIIPRRLKKVKKGPKLLELANVFGPLLNDSLTFKIPITRLSINKQIFPQIEQMRQTAAHHRMAYLTANQVQSFYRVFLIHKLLPIEKKTQLNTNAQFNVPQDYEVYINPEILESKGLEEVQESCLTFPFLKFMVPRYKEITLKFRDETREVKHQNFDGLKAQMIQHCINHLDGELLIDYSLSHGKFFVQKDSATYFPKTSFLLREYGFRLKDFHALSEPTDEQKKAFESMKTDYLGRLKGEYEKESQNFSEKLSKKNINIL